MALITLTSDIGANDYLAGAIKGQLLQINPAFTLVDITHNLRPFNYVQSAYVCRNALKQFPPFSFHVLMVNLFDTRPVRLLMAFHQDQYYFCADNGLLTMILEEKPEMVIGLPVPENTGVNTLDCAAIIGKAIKALQEGKSLMQIGTPDVSMVEKNPLKPMIGDNWIEGQIIFIDNFENIVVNITRERISHTYADVPEGEKLALFNSAGYLEIAINKGNAAGLFGLQGFSEQSQQIQSRLFYQTARVLFE